MKIIDGKINIKEEDFGKLELKGYLVSRHTKYYSNFIGFEFNGLSASFQGWNENLRFYIEAEGDFILDLKIKNENDLKNALNFVDSLILLSNIN